MGVQSGLSWSKHGHSWGIRSLVCICLYSAGSFFLWIYRPAMYLEVRESTQCIREIARGSVYCNIAFEIKARYKSRGKNSAHYEGLSLYFMIRNLRIFLRTN